MIYRIGFIIAIWIIALSAYAQNELLIVEGGIEGDSLVINNLPAFRAEMTQDFDLTIHPVTIQYDSPWSDSPVPGHETLFDNGNNFDTGLGQGFFRAPRSGIYYFQLDLLFESDRFFDELIDAYIAVTNPVIGPDLVANSLKGTFNLTTGGNTDSTTPAKAQRAISGILNLKEGQKVGVYMTYTSGPGFGNFIINAYSSFSGFLIMDTD